MVGDVQGDLVSDEVFVGIQRFLNREAILLDRRAYADWFSLVTPDIRYVVNAQVTREAQLPRLHFALIDDKAIDLKARVDQISTPKLTHAENPPTLTRRFISGLEAWSGATGQEYIVHSSILIYRSRPGQDDGLYSGARRDVLRLVEGSLRLAGREVWLDHTLLQGAVSILL